jgi:hypothetical protein
MGQCLSALLRSLRWGRTSHGWKSNSRVTEDDQRYFVVTLSKGTELADSGSALFLFYAINHFLLDRNSFPVTEFASMPAKLAYGLVIQWHESCELAQNP